MCILHFIELLLKTQLGRKEKQLHNGNRNTIQMHCGKINCFVSVNIEIITPAITQIQFKL